MKLFFVLIILLSELLFSQSLNEKEIIRKVQAQIDKVEDFSVDAFVKVDMEKVKVPNMSVSINYKRPDKFSIKSKNFALVPKEALGFNVLKLIKSYKYESIKKIKTDSAVFYEITYLKNIYDETIPSNLGLIINSSNYTIHEIKSYQERISRIAKINFEYDKFENEIFLPSKCEIKFEIDTLSYSNKNIKGINKSFNGFVKISYQNYQINKGLHDSLFVEKKSN